jgi:hypothetical protein
VKKQHQIRVWQNKRGWYAECVTCQERTRACATEESARAIYQLHVDGILGVEADRKRRQR